MYLICYVDCRSSPLFHGLLFILLICSFAMQNTLNFIQSNLCTFPALLVLDILQKILLKQGHENLYQCFFLSRFIILVYIHMYIFYLYKIYIFNLFVVRFHGWYNDSYFLFLLWKYNLADIILEETVLFSLHILDNSAKYCLSTDVWVYFRNHILFCWSMCFRSQFVWITKAL